MYSLADGVENAVVVCCFITSDYEKSENCQLELQYAIKRHKTIVPCIIDNRSALEFVEWLDSIMTDLKCIDFRDISESSIPSKTKQFMDRINEEIMASPYLSSDSTNEPIYLFELIKREYKRNSCIERLMDSSKSFPIEESYINLSLIECKEEREKEKNLRDTKHNDIILDTFEDIYEVKMPMDIKDIFIHCKEQSRRILILGRAGIGKSTFCRYAAHQWATANLWPEYELVVLVPLRSLTETRYPLLANSNRHCLGDIIERECFGYDLTEKDRQFLKLQLHKIKVLWLLDGYDEIAQNAPQHLQYLFEQILKTSHHIMTSRPYSNILPYNVQLEITGFTDENIPKYVTRFFEQIHEDFDNPSDRLEKCLKLLKSNLRIWGIAHIPVNLELICSIWCDIDWSETKSMTITILYDNIIEWLLKRYLIRQNISIQITTQELYQYCEKELIFLERLAFEAMINNTILIRKELLQKVMTNIQCTLRTTPNLLNIGILKSFDDGLFKKRADTEKQHYFVHLSFQEYFAARYVVNGLQGNDPEQCIKFIKDYKYNLRFILVFIFASGLLIRTGDKKYINIFWATLLEEPRDLVGFRHVQLVISCFDEAECSRVIHAKDGIIEFIVNWMKYIFSIESHTFQKNLQTTLELSTSLVNISGIQNALIQLLRDQNEDIKNNVLLLITKLPITNPIPELVDGILEQLKSLSSEIKNNALTALSLLSGQRRHSELINELITALFDKNYFVWQSVIKVLRQLNDKSATDKVIDILVTVLRNSDEKSRLKASKTLSQLGENIATNQIVDCLLVLFDDGDRDSCLWASRTLRQLGEKAITSDVIDRLLIASEHSHPWVRSSVCRTLSQFGEKAVTNKVVHRLAMLLEDSDQNVRFNAYQTLGHFGTKAVASQVVHKLAMLLEDSDQNVRSTACYTLGQLGKQALTSEVTSRLLMALKDNDPYVRLDSLRALARLDEQKSTTELIRALEFSLIDEDLTVRSSAYEIIHRLGKKAATSAVINSLVSALEDNDQQIRLQARDFLNQWSENEVTLEDIDNISVALGDSNQDICLGACRRIRQLGEKAAINDVISRLMNLLTNTDSNIRLSACQTLSQLGKKAATNAVIARLAILLGDIDKNVRLIACQTIGKLSENATTEGVVTRLTILLEDSDADVRLCACQTIGELDGKVVTRDIIYRLVIMLGDLDRNIHLRAYKVLRRICQVSTSIELINGLIMALDADDYTARINVCNVIDVIGEKVVTNEIINRLVNLLSDSDRNVCLNACRTLAKLGEKVTTVVVMSRLLTYLEDEEQDVRLDVCDNLSRFGRNAATEEIIDKVVTLLKPLLRTVEDIHPQMCSSACRTLSRFGEKIATDEIIRIFVNLLGNSNKTIFLSACLAVARLGEKAATFEVIDKLVSTINSNDSYMCACSSHALDELVKAVPKMRNCLEDVENTVDESFYSRMKFLELSLESGDHRWISVFIALVIHMHCAVIVVNEHVIVYGRRESVEITMPSNHIRDELIKGFRELSEKIHSSQ